MKLPPLNALKAFEAAARSGSFVAAGEELGVSSSAVSMQVRNLELFLTKKLFVRSNNRITLTDAGRAIYPETAGALNGIAALTDRVLEDDVRVPYILSTAASLAERWLAPQLSGFAGLTAGLSMEIRIEDDPIDFARENIDLRITYGDQLYPAFRSVELFHDEVAPMCSPEFAAAAIFDTNLDQLPDEHFIHVDWGTAYASHPTWNDWFRTMGRPRRPNIKKGLKVAAPSFAIALAGSGLGIGLCHKLLARSELGTGQLMEISTQTLPLSQPYCAVLPHAKSGDDYLGRLLDWLCRPTA